MALTLKNLSGKPKTITVEWEDETATVTFLPGKLTPETMEELRGEDPEAGEKAIVTLLSVILKRWDVVDDQGDPLPTDAATLRGLPLNFLAHVLQKCQEAMTPGEAPETSFSG